MKKITFQYFFPYETTKNFLVIKNYICQRNIGPDYVDFFKSGNVVSKSWGYTNFDHRIDGPAFIIYDSNGDIVTEEYFLNNEQYSEEAYYKAIKIICFQ